MENKSWTGIGRATKDDYTYVVERYKPPGKLMGKEQENIFNKFCIEPP